MRRNRLLCAVISGVALAACAERTPVTVTGFSWERAIVIEELKTFTENSGRVPVGGRVKRTYKKFTGFKEVFDIPIPTFEQWYEYEIDRWVHGRTISARGDDRSPVWPAVELKSNERVKGETGIYRVHLAGPSKSALVAELAEAAWQEVDQNLTYDASVLNGVARDLRTPEAAR